MIIRKDQVPLDRGTEEGTQKYGAAESLGPRYTEESELAHLLDVLPGELGPFVECGSYGGDFFPSECADHFAHCQVLIAEVKRIVHDRLSVQAASVSSAP